MANKKISMFEYLKLITTSKDVDVMETYIKADDFDKTYKSARFMIHRYLSMAKKTESIIFNQQTILDKMGNESHLRYLMKIVPRVGYIKYLK